MFVIDYFFLQTINWPLALPTKKERKSWDIFSSSCLLLLLIFLVFNWWFQLKKSSSHTQPGFKEKLKWVIYICPYFIRWLLWIVLFSLKSVSVFITYYLSICVFCHYPHLSNYDFRSYKNSILPGLFFSSLFFPYYWK